MIPRKEGYYWYKEVDEIDGRNHPVRFMNWDVVKVQFYSRGYDKRYKKELKLKTPILMFMIFNCWTKTSELFDVDRAQGVWGKRINSLREY